MESTLQPAFILPPNLKLAWSIIYYLLSFVSLIIICLYSACSTMIQAIKSRGTMIASYNTSKMMIVKASTMVWRIDLIDIHDNTTHSTFQ